MRRRTENNSLAVLSTVATEDLAYSTPASVPTTGATPRLAFGSPSTSPSAAWEPSPANPNLAIEHGLSPRTVRSSISDPVGSHVSALQRWHALSRTLALVNVQLDRMVARCFDLFFEYLFPLTPLVHEPSLRDGVAFFLAQGAAGAGTSWSECAPNNMSMGPLADSTFTLITAVCAEAAFLLPKSLFAEGSTVADAFLQASRCCLNHYLEADLENPNANSVAIRYFHSNCLHAAGKPKYSWHIFGEATRLAQVMQLHEESSLDKLYPIEAEMRRRVFWIVYMGDKSAAILNNRPITIHKYSFESGITTRYPTGIEEEPVTTSAGGPSPSNSNNETCRHGGFIDGFNANLRLWQAASDLLLEIRLMQDQQPNDLPPATPTLKPEHRQRLDALYVRFITCLDDLPPYLQSYTFPAVAAATAGKETQSNQFIIQCANLQVSQHCLRMVITQKFEYLAYYGTGPEQADLRRTEIARDMLRVMHEAPFWSLQVNGEPYVSEVRSGANSAFLGNDYPSSMTY